MRRRMLLALLVLVCAGAATCGLPGRKIARVGEQDAGRTIELRLGDRLEVTLPGNPTTGYSWVVSATDSAVLSQVGEPTFKADSTLVGSGGAVTLAFQTEGKGKTQLRLAYQRPWEKDVPPTKTYEVTIAVN